jgi:hypothetical protein
MASFIYTGIGSRKAPRDVLEKTYTLGYLLAKRGYKLRSGRAMGMDEAFEAGCTKYEKVIGILMKEIYLPWDGFRKTETTLSGGEYIQSDIEAETCGELLVSKKILRGYGVLKSSIKRLFSRNVYQVTGQDSAYSDFVIYWCLPDEDNRPTGGTRVAVELAKSLGIPTYNLCVKEQSEALYKRLGI